MDIAELDDVDSHSAEHWEPGWMEVGGAAIANHPVEFEVEVSGHHLEAGQRFVDVVVGVGEHGCCAA